MERKAKALKGIDIKSGKGLELGPLYSPIVLKSEANIYYIDHMSAEGLRKKYKGHPFDVNEIVDVDYVVGGSTLRKILKGEEFDYVIASHVIEHIPDVISWLQDISSVLKIGGILSLVVPDKRYTFDISRDVSRPSEIIGAYLDKQTKSDSAMIYDSAAEYKEITPIQAWSGDIPESDEPKKRNLDEAIRKSKLNLKPGEYVDIHCYVFTPQSFVRILRRLIEHDLFDYKVEYFTDTAKDELEFYISFKKVSPGYSKAKKLASLPKMPKFQSTEELEKKIATLEEQLGAITNSKSWKVTKPLRKVYKTTKSIR